MNPWSLERLADDRRAALQRDARGGTRLDRSEARAVREAPPPPAVALSRTDRGFSGAAHPASGAARWRRARSHLTRSVGGLLVRAGTRLLGPAHSL